MRNQTQGPATSIHHPVPADLLPAVAQMWWSAFAPPFARAAAPAVRADHAIVEIDGRPGIAGVIGLRTGDGGFLRHVPVMARLLFRAAPPTSDLVIDGILARERRTGTGRRLIAAADMFARQGGYPALRAEVQAGNHEALAFYDALGFSSVGSGRFGWPWSGRIVILRREVAAL